MVSALGAPACYLPFLPFFFDPLAFRGACARSDAATRRCARVELGLLNALPAELAGFLLVDIFRTTFRQTFAAVTQDYQTHVPPGDAGVMPVQSRHPHGRGPCERRADASGRCRRGTRARPSALVGLHSTAGGELLRIRELDEHVCQSPSVVVPTLQRRARIPGQGKQDPERPVAGSVRDSGVGDGGSSGVSEPALQPRRVDRRTLRLLRLTAAAHSADFPSWPHRDAGRKCGRREGR